VYIDIGDIMSYYNDYDYGYDDGEISEFSYESSSNKNKVKKAMAEINKQDKRCHQIKRQVGTGKKKTITVFSSGQQGCRIRNAITGEYYNHEVGSEKEDLYFKVIIATAENGTTDPITLFYESPQQYERVMFCMVNPKIKEIWNTKNLNMRIKIEKTSSSK